MENAELLKGRTALVTGGTSGIGFYTARALARLGAAVYITGRDEPRGEHAARQIRQDAHHEGVHYIQADASTVGSNQQLACQILTETDRLHILVNNVGGLYNDRWETGDGYEATLAMNLVGPFTLTEALVPLLLHSAPARIVNVTSAGYAMWKGDPFQDLQTRQNFTGFDAYNRSKYLNLLWTLALARRLEGTGIVANALHPGTAWTALTQRNEIRLLPPNLRPLFPIFRLLQRVGSAERASRTCIYLASAPEASHVTGQYFESSTSPKRLAPALLDQARHDKTFELAASLVRNAPTSTAVNAVEAIPIAACANSK